MFISRCKYYLPYPLLSAHDVQHEIKNVKHKRQGNLVSRNKSIKPDSEIIHILDLSDRGYTIIMIYIFKYPVEKGDILHEQMGNFSTEIGTIRKSSVEML